MYARVTSDTHARTPMRRSSSIPRYSWYISHPISLSHLQNQFSKQDKEAITHKVSEKPNGLKRGGGARKTPRDLSSVPDYLMPSKVGLSRSTAC